jgi:hypothetical protein
VEHLVGEKLEMIKERPLFNSIRHYDLDQYTKWLRPVPWKLFCTFTFAWSVSDAQAIKVFDALIERLEIAYRCPIVYVRGDEKRFSGCGEPGAPRHFHALLAAAFQLAPRVVSDFWHALAGRRKGGTGANVRIYDPSLDGVRYVLKFINDPNGDWAFRNLDLGLPASGVANMNCKGRRRSARNIKRKERAK